MHKTPLHSPKMRALVRSIITKLAHCSESYSLAPRQSSHFSGDIGGLNSGESKSRY